MVSFVVSPNGLRCSCAAFRANVVACHGGEAAATVETCRGREGAGLSVQASVASATWDGRHMFISDCVCVSLGYICLSIHPSIHLLSIYICVCVCVYTAAYLPVEKCTWVVCVCVISVITYTHMQRKKKTLRHRRVKEVRVSGLAHW